jgi:hypothetical protein
MTITVNGLPFTTDKPSLSYDQIVDFAGELAVLNPMVTWYTRFSETTTREGILRVGMSVAVRDGMIFHCLRRP